MGNFNGSSPAYDANGNARARNGNTIGWTSYNYLSSVGASAESATFDYGPNHQRWRMVYNGPSGTETTYYVSPMFEAVFTPAGTDFRHYLFANGRTVGVISRTTSGAVNVRSLLTDHQGSISSIVADATGTATANESFTAYGNRRGAGTWSGTPTGAELTAMNGVTRQGYTFQTVLGSMGLNHMNGRVEDAVTGRFLSADPQVSYPTNTQDFDLYSFVHNNPLTNIDPSGFQCSVETTGSPGSIEYFESPDGEVTFTVTGSTLQSIVTCDNSYQDWRSPNGGDGQGQQKPATPEIVVTARRPSMAQSPKPIKDFLCQNSGDDSAVQQATDNVGTGGSAADSIRPVVAVGATAAGTSNVAYPQATSFLGSQLVSALSTIGKAGQLASAGGIFYTLVSGNYQSALYGTADYFVYSALADFGAASAIPTAGLGTATAGAATLLYYHAGGSKGLVQGAACP